VTFLLTVVGLLHVMPGIASAPFTTNGDVTAFVQSSENKSVSALSGCREICAYTALLATA